MKSTPKKQKHNPGISRAFCDERFGQFSNRVYSELTEIKTTLTDMNEKKDTKSRDWRILAFTIIGSLITGAMLLGAQIFLNI